MKARLIIVLLLAVVMLMASPFHPAVARMSPRVDAEEESKLSAEEEREVRELVARFAERWRATTDFQQIIDEMFVPDYSARLWSAPVSEMPWWLLDKNLIAYAGRDELRHYYTASLNFYGLYHGLYEATEESRQASDADGEIRLTDVLSSEVLNLLLTDPTLAELQQMYSEDYEHENTEEAESGQPAPSVDSAQAAGATPQADRRGNDEEASEEGLIKSVPQMNNYTTTLEKANELLRKRLASLSPAAPRPAGSGDGDDTQSKKDSLEIYPTTLEERDYNYHAGTPVVRLKLLPFTLTLVKTDGRFKILTVAIYID
jgi:hypothetical protein